MVGNSYQSNNMSLDDLIDDIVFNDSDQSDTKSMDD